MVVEDKDVKVGNLLGRKAGVAEISVEGCLDGGGQRLGFVKGRTEGPDVAEVG